jgi:hypothetical protein
MNADLEEALAFLTARQERSGGPRPENDGDPRPE